MASPLGLASDLPSTQDPLYVRLLPIAEAARRGVGHLRRTTLRCDADCQSREEFDALSEYAAWEAYRTVCADPDAPNAVETFDWTGEHQTLVKYAMLIMERDVKGRASVYGDWRRRSRVRKLGAIVDAVAHDAWRRSGGEQEDVCTPGQGGATIRRGYRTYGGSEEVLTEYAAESAVDELSEFRDAVRAALTPYEFSLIDRHYWGGIAQRELAAELVEAGRYEDTPSGWTRAEVAVNVAISKARRKLARRLAGTWRMMAREVA